MPITVATQWSNPVFAGDCMDPDRHERFATYALEVTREAMPDLYSFLDASGATVIAGPCMFSFSTPAAAGAWLDVPDMAARLNLLPWVDPHETAH